MLKLREFLELANGKGLVVTDWEKLDRALIKEASAFLDHSFVCNEGEMSSQPTQRAADFACTCGKCEPLEGNEEFCKFTRRPIPQSR